MMAFRLIQDTDDKLRSQGRTLAPLNLWSSDDRQLQFHIKQSPDGLLIYVQLSDGPVLAVPSIHQNQRTILTYCIGHLSAY